jgi:hypothetical protein
MAFNIMELIQSSLTADTIGSVAKALNLDGDLVKKGLMAAMPAILAGVLGRAKEPEGREALDSALDSVDDDMLGKLGGMLSGEGQSPLISMGGGLLKNFLGEKGAGQLGGALSSNLGISRESSGSLLGIATPLLMSLLSVRKKTEGLDTGGLVDTLFSQKDQIVKAIPDGLGSELRGTGALGGMLDDIGASAAATATAAGAAAQSAAASSQRAMGDAQRAVGNAAKETSSSSWLKWVIIALVVLGVLYFLAGGLTREDAAPTMGDAVTMEELTVGGTNIGTAVQDLMGDLSSTLASVTDGESARDAVPDLREIGDRLGRIESAVGQLPPQGRSALSGMINASMPSVEATAERVLGDSATASVVKPVLDDILGRLSALARG